MTTAMTRLMTTMESEFDQLASLMSKAWKLENPHAIMPELA
jgi:hypothetical protein